MNQENKEYIIYREVASIINSLAITYNKVNYYDLFCGTLNIARHVNMQNRICTDKSEITIEMLKAFISDDTHRLGDLISYSLDSMLNNIIDDSIETDLRHVLNMLNMMYKAEENEDDKFTTLDDIIDYNKYIHLERLDKDEILDISTIKDIELDCKDYRQVEIKDNSIVLCYIPYENDNILSETFGFRSFFNWVKDKSSGDNIVLILSKDLPDKDFEVIEDFSKLIKKSSIDKRNLKLYVTKNSCLIKDTEDVQYDF